MHTHHVGTLPGGQPALIFTLQNAAGATAAILNYGGTLMSLQVPDAKGELADVVLGLASWEDYLEGHPMLGTLIGRYGNRIAHGAFSLDGQTYQLARNLPPHHLHGGEKGYDKVVWEGETEATPAGESVLLRYLSPAGEAGYPGNLSIEVRYTLTPDHALQIDYRATTDAPTVVNLTQHAYFNLAGAGQGDILDHEVRLFASHYTPIDETVIPTGEILPVRGTAFDFTSPVAIGTRLAMKEEQLVRGTGFDHNFVLDEPGGVLGLAARVRDPQSGRSMEVLTTQPGVQFYTANHVSELKGRDGAIYQPHSAFCLETQHFPDSPNQPHFPSTRLDPGAVYEEQTVYRFFAE